MNAIENKLVKDTFLGSTLILTGFAWILVAALNGPVQLRDPGFSAGGGAVATVAPAAAKPARKA